MAKPIIAGVAGLLMQGTSCGGFEQRGFAAGQQQQRVAAPGANSAEFSSPSPPQTSCRRSNSTHIIWSEEEEDGESEGTIQPFSDAVNDCVRYLRRNIMPFDVPHLAGTLDGIMIFG